MSGLIQIVAVTGPITVVGSVNTSVVNVSTSARDSIGRPTGYAAWSHGPLSLEEVGAAVGRTGSSGIDGQDQLPGWRDAFAETRRPQAR